MNNLHILRRDLKDWSIMPDTAEQSYWLKGMPLLIMRRYQLALTSCVARCRFGRLVLVAINHTELLWNAIQSSGAAWQRWFSVSRLTFHIIYFGLLCVHTGLWKRLVESCGGRGFWMLPSAPCHQYLPWSSACLCLKRKRGRVIPTFALLVNFFLPQSQKRLVTRARRHGGEPRCKALVKLRGESAVD